MEGAPVTADLPDRAADTERDDREPKPCPVCGERCVYDGWDHVHPNGIGIGSCAAVAARPAGQDEVLRRPDEWCRLKGVYVLDPDGWRDDGAPSWIEPITEAEFDRRLSICTQAPWDWATNQPLPRSPAPPSPGTDLREEIARAIYERGRADNGAGSIARAEMLADAVLDTPALRRLLDAAAAVERVRALVAVYASDPYCWTKGDDIAGSIRDALDGVVQSSTIATGSPLPSGQSATIQGAESAQRGAQGNAGNPSRGIGEETEP